MQYKLTITTEDADQLKNQLSVDDIYSQLWQFSNKLREIRKYRELSEEQSKLLEEIIGHFTSLQEYVDA